MVSRNDSYNPYSTADSESKKIAHGMLVAWAKAGTHMTRQPALDVRTAVICFCGQKFKDQNGSERQVASQGFMGASFLGGAQNGPSIAACASIATDSVASEGARPCTNALETAAAAPPNAEIAMCHRRSPVRSE